MNDPSQPSPLREKPETAQQNQVRTKLPLSKWIAGFLSIEVVWAFLGGHVTTLLMGILPPFLLENSIVVEYLSAHINFLVLLLALLAFIRWVANMDPRTFITDAPTFRWQVLFTISGIWIVGCALLTVVTVLIAPHSIRYQTTPTSGARLGMLVYILLFTPMQCFVEELFFRTMLYRMLDGRFARKWMVSLISGLLFMLAHLSNHEVTASISGLAILIYYFLTGFLFMELNRVSHGSEASIGAHMGNNLYLAIMVNYTGSSLQTMPFFIQDKIPVIVDLVVLTICSLVSLRWLAAKASHQ